MRTQRYKYPRTWHLPWSPGATDDDLCLDTTAEFVGKQIVVTEKMDGENTTLYSDHIHARSTDSRHHPSRNWVKAFHGQVAHQIPEGWRVCGENLYARHSIPYNDLSSFFLAFSIWNEDNICLSWAETTEWLSLLGVNSVPVLFEGRFDQDALQQLDLDLETSEGYVVRLADRFPYEQFSQSVAKWVRSGHVQTDRHWMHDQIIPNKLRTET